MASTPYFYILTIFLALCQNFESIQAAQYGEPCTVDNDPCDVANFLECDPATSQCRCVDEPTGAYYDQVDLKCHKFEGVECTTAGMSCPRNGACSGSLVPPRCACTKISSYIPTPTRKCAKAYNAGCSSDNQCDMDAFVECGSGNKCLCVNAVDETSYFDDKLKACFILANRECTVPSSQPVMPCRAWTSCLPDLDDPTKHTCQCDDGLVNNGDSCIVSFGDSCEGGKPCDDNNWHSCLANNKTCGCKFPLDHLGGGVCRVPIDRSCSGGLPCDENNYLTCVTNKCVCQSGLVKTEEGLCRAILGETCDSSLAPCDENSFLECVDSNCQCDAAHPLHAQGDACTSKYDDKCDPDNDRCDGDNFMICETTKKCGCGTLGHPDQNKTTCLLSYNSRCQDDGTGQQCDSVGQYLECKFGKCACAEGSIFDEFNGCVLLAGASCQPIEEGGQPCDTSHFYGCYDRICDCSSDSHLDIGLGACVLNEGANCVQDGQPCDPSKFLVCDLDNQICGCDTTIEAHMDPTSQQCVLPHNAACEEGGQNCDPVQFLGCQDQICGCGPDAEWSDETSGGTCLLNFDASCGRSDQLCNEEKYLTCDSFRCQCHKNATWNSEEVNCFLNYKSPCGGLADDQTCDETNYFYCNLSSNTCDCDGTVISDIVSGQLLCVLNYQDSCTPGGDNRPCDPSKFLECHQTELNCSCAEGAFMDPGSGRCALNIGQTCEIGDDKQPCDPVNYSVCLVDTETCGCDLVTSVLHPDLHSCVLNYGAVCEVGEDKQKCDDREVLTCQVNGPNVRCGCDEELGLVYDSVNQKCALGPGSPCTDSGDCAVNSECVDAKCVCMEGFSPNRVNVCVRPYGAPCAGDECDAEANQKCDTTCVCANRLGMEYVAADKRCYTKLHQPCNTTVPINSCMLPNLICDRASETCLCDPYLGFVDDDGVQTCRKGFGSVCNGDDCNFSANTECSSTTNTCGCAEGYEWVVGTLPRCAGTFDAPCRDDEDCHTAASFACHDGRCRCDPNGQVHESNFCFGVSGGPCNTSKVLDPEPVRLCQKNLVCQPIDGQRLGQCSGVLILTNSFVHLVTLMVVCIVGMNYLF